MKYREKIDRYITEAYGTEKEYPWIKYPSFAVYRHKSNKKWFAVIMELPKSRFIPGCDGNVQVINLKCDPIMIGSLICDEGIFPGYHMNKCHWISVFLNGSVEWDKLIWLVEISHSLTKGRNK